MWVYVYLNARRGDKQHSPTLTIVTIFYTQPNRAFSPGPSFPCRPPCCFSKFGVIQRQSKVPASLVSWDCGTTTAGAHHQRTAEKFVLNVHRLSRDGIGHETGNVAVWLFACNNRANTEATTTSLFPTLPAGRVQLRQPFYQQNASAGLRSRHAFPAPVARPHNYRQL